MRYELLALQGDLELRLSESLEAVHERLDTAIQSGKLYDERSWVSDEDLMAYMDSALTVFYPDACIERAEAVYRTLRFSYVVATELFGRLDDVEMIRMIDDYTNMPDARGAALHDVYGFLEHKPTVVELIEDYAKDFDLDGTSGFINRYAAAFHLMLVDKLRETEYIDTQLEELEQYWVHEATNQSKHS